MNISIRSAEVEPPLSEEDRFPNLAAEIINLAAVPGAADTLEQARYFMKALNVALEINQRERQLQTIEIEKAVCGAGK